MKVLVPVEDDFVAKSQIEFLLSYKWPAKTEIRLVHVLHTLIVERSMVSSQVYLDKLMKEARKYAENLMSTIEKTLKKESPEIKVTREFVEGAPVEEIVGLAKKWESDMIVLCSHGREGLGQLILGSVSYNVLVHSPCKVIIVGLPHHERGQGDPSEWKDAHVQVTIR